MQSLLFCPDENSARALTPLVEGLEIIVKRETEVYSAMTSLMAESFDFLIVDCEDEPTGRLLLRNAHGSALNKGAVAVAIVDPETGANALRFGADFLITKPVIAAQAEKVLRLVRTSILRRQPGSAKTAPQAAAAKTTAALSPGATLEVQDRAHGQSGNEPAPLKEELRIELPPAASAQPDPTPAPEIENAPLREEITTKSQPAGKGAATKTRKTKPRPSVVWLAAALGVILLIVAASAWHIDFVHLSKNQRTAVQPSNAAPTAPTVPSNASDPVSGVSTAVPVQAAPEPQMEAAPLVATAPVDSNAGTEAEVDAHEKSARRIPRSLPIVSPNRKAVTTSKPGHEPEIRPIKVDSGVKSSTALSTQFISTVLVDSDPPGATLWMDGRDTGRMTPAQIAVDKPGSHTFVFKKQGYLDETIATNLKIGQTFHLAPSLHALGRADEIKMVGKFSKLFGGSAAAAGMGWVKVKTLPKGAQIAVNTRILEKTSPAEFYLNPGNYAIDVTLPGFKTVHRVVSVNKGGRVAIDEVMNHE